MKLLNKQRSFTKERSYKTSRLPSPFWAIIQKEISDHIRSLRFTIILFIIVLACIGSVYAAIVALQTTATAGDQEQNFLFLKMFTASDGTLPNFIAFVTFLGPLMGISLAFDAVNSERSKGTLSRLMSQPIYRSDVILAKFTASLLIIATSIYALGFLVMGLSLITIGFPPTPEQFWRIFLFLSSAIVYIAFWLVLALLFSIRFRQAATSALSSIAIWIFFTIFFDMIINLIAKAIAPTTGSESDIISYQQMMMGVNRLSPAQLFSEVTSTLLTPEIRTLGPLTMKQIYGALPAPLPLSQSLLLIWPQLTGMLALTLLCFAASYFLFMRQEIRSRN